ncbi:MAG: nucleoid-associated protein [Bacteroidales bacterium]|nr:nucleoid-associated protein [Bacteroidales bacterium]
MNKINNLTLGRHDKFIVHFVGNKTNGNGVQFSNALTQCKDIEAHIKNLIDNNFKLEDLYGFYFTPQLELNPIFNFVSLIFETTNEFVEQSQNCARYLYDKSIHPQIKSGELCFSYFRDCVFNGKTIDCISIFKSENKDTFLKIHSRGNIFEIESESGININKLDKGCLIFNIEKENGYVVAIVDNTNKGTEAKYWTDDFLHVRPRKDSFNQTQNMLSLCKSFVSQLPNENGKIEKATYMNRSVKALKEESVNVDAFAEQVFETPKLVSEFKQYKETYQRERDMEIDDTFETVSTAIKRKGTGQ